MTVICTHSGKFHCDEALACFLLKQIPTYKDAEIVRSRDPAVIDAADIVVDVGGVFDEAKNRFDHHQRGFEETFSEKHRTKLSSAGLVYKYFGEEVLNVVASNNVDKEDLKTIYIALYEGFVEGLDAIDNGISQYGDAQPLYSETTDLGSRVNRLNPMWNEEGDINENERFEQAMAMAGSEFLQRIDIFTKSWLPARSIVVDALKNRKNVDESGLIIELSKSCPWKSHIFNIEKELGLKENELPLYIIFGSNNDWRIQAIPPHEDTFDCRKKLPENWRGIRDQELSTLSNIENCVFCHAGGFIGGNKTREGALKMARAALQL